MYALNRSTEKERVLLTAAEHIADRKRKHGSYAFSSRHKAVAHRLVNLALKVIRRCRKLVKRLVYRIGILSEFFLRCRR